MSEPGNPPPPSVPAKIPVKVPVAGAAGTPMKVPMKIPMGVPMKIPVKVPVGPGAVKLPTKVPPKPTPAPPAPVKAPQPVPQPVKKVTRTFGGDDDDDDDELLGAKKPVAPTQPKAVAPKPQTVSRPQATPPRRKRPRTPSPSSSSSSSSSEDEDLTPADSEDETVYRRAKKKGWLDRDVEEWQEEAVKVKPPRPPRTKFPSDIPAKLESIKLKINATEANMRIKDGNKSVSLSTSKINYIDPRVMVAWSKRANVPLNKIFNQTLIKKFPWAMDEDPDYVF